MLFTSQISKRYFSKSGQKLRAAVLLSGCGAKDGAEITESVATFVALSRHGYEIECCATPRFTSKVYDHIGGG
jgi:enhancing lycopene biosynthesis protein 2